MIDGLKKRLGVNIDKFGSGSSNRYVDSCCVVSVIYEQGYAIGRLSQTLQSAPKEIRIMSTTMGEIGKDVQYIEKEMEYYASKLHQVDQRIDYLVHKHHHQNIQ